MDLRIVPIVGPLSRLPLWGALLILAACGGEESDPPAVPQNADVEVQTDFGEMPLPDRDADTGVGDLGPEDSPEPDVLPDLEPDPDIQRDLGCASDQTITQEFDCRGGETIEVVCPCVDGGFFCAFDPATDCRPIACDDGEPLTCDDELPLCRPGEQPALRGGCWACVDQVTCEVFTPCEHDRECADHQHCDPCATSSCPECDDCIGACVTSPCESASAIGCSVARPDCAAGEVAVIQDGCWVCVNQTTCEPYEGACRTHLDCGPAELCDPCGTSSCPDCEDCVPACVDTECDTEATPTCEEFRPECAPGLVAVVEGGCWLCVETAGCGLPPECGHVAGFCTGGPAGCPEGASVAEEALCRTLGDCCIPDDPNACARIDGGCFPADIPCPEGFAGDPSVPCLPDRVCCAPADPPERPCDDGSTLICESEVPVCDEWSELALVAGCWECVNSETCRSWGEAGCLDFRDCDSGEFCDFCGTSSCPGCADCVPACEPTE